MNTAKSKYVRDFESLFVPIKANDIRDKARSGQLGHCQFRSLCWRYFLRCLPEQYDKWLEHCKASRRLYDEIRKKHSASKKLDNQQQQQQQQQSQTNSSPSQAGTNNKDQPDSNIPAKSKEQDEASRQYSNTCNHKNVFRTIERDVVRTFPDMEFFRQTEMQVILENVLFYFASENPQLSYKQGMHELLATLLYVLHTDAQNCFINYEGGYADDNIATLLDMKYLEHDVFHLFSALMRSIESWYQNDEVLMVPEKPLRREQVGLVSSLASSRYAKQQQVKSVLGIKFEMISKNIVKNYDSELYNHLEALQIAPQIYGIRWMRLLFGREFEFLDLLSIWDAIICDQVSMSLIDYIFASMLLAIREELVNGDYTDCLNKLMRYSFKDVRYVIMLALHLRNPRNIRPRLSKYNNNN